MSTRHPPRKEPRILSVGTVPHGLIFAVIDPWVIRSTGRTYCREPSRAAAILRLIRREKPTAVVVGDPELSERARVSAEKCGIGFVSSRPPRIPSPIARELYPELPLFAPGHLGRIAALGISAVLHQNPIARKYAHSRHHST